jgi:hypothetical protein
MDTHRDSDPEDSDLKTRAARKVCAVRDNPALDAGARRAHLVAPQDAGRASWCTSKGHWSALRSGSRTQIYAICGAFSVCRSRNVHPSCPHGNVYRLENVAYRVAVGEGGANIVRFEGALEC